MFFFHTNKKTSNEHDATDLKSLDTPRGFWSDITVFALIVLLFVVPIRLFVAQPFIVNGSSMEPTFATGQYLIIDELTYRFGRPERGDVIVFNFPDDPKKFFIKRIIGLPGETVAIQNGHVVITNAEHPDGIILQEPYLPTNTQLSESLSVTLGDHDYFVMGDNRNASFDSRAWGPLDQNLIVGRALLRLFPIQAIDVLPGDYVFP